MSIHKAALPVTLTVTVLSAAVLLPAACSTKSTSSHKADSSQDQTSLGGGSGSPPVQVSGGTASAAGASCSNEPLAVLLQKQQAAAQATALAQTDAVNQIVKTQNLAKPGANVEQDFLLAVTDASYCNKISIFAPQMAAVASCPDTTPSAKTAAGFLFKQNIVYSFVMNGANYSFFLGDGSKDNQYLVVDAGRNALFLKPVATKATNLDVMPCACPENQDSAAHGPTGVSPMTATNPNPANTMVATSLGAHAAADGSAMVAPGLGQPTGMLAISNANLLASEKVHGSVVNQGVGAPPTTTMYLFAESLAGIKADLPVPYPDTSFNILPAAPAACATSGAVTNP